MFKRIADKLKQLNRWRRVGSEGQYHIFQHWFWGKMYISKKDYDKRGSSK